MKPILSYAELLQITAGYSVDDLTGFINKIKKTQIQSPEYAQYKTGASGTYIISYPKSEYLYLDDGVGRIVGYTTDQVQALVKDPKAPLWHKPDQHIQNTVIYPATITFLQTIPIEQHPHYRITTNYRVHNKAGQLRNIQQKSYFIRSTDDGLPLIAIGFVEDISEIRNDNLITHTITHIIPGSDPATMDNVVYSDKHFANDANFTPREIAVLLQIAKGYSYREVAYNLDRSVSTVDNQIRKLFKKTNLNKITDLVAYAHRNGYAG